MCGFPLLWPTYSRGSVDGNCMVADLFASSPRLPTESARPPYVLRESETSEILSAWGPLWFPSLQATLQNGSSVFRFQLQPQIKVQGKGVVYNMVSRLCAITALVLCMQQVPRVSNPGRIIRRPPIRNSGR